MLRVYSPNLSYIYALIDPQTQNVRYVGKTNNLKRRLRHHIKHSLEQPEFRVHNWIKSLLASGLKPEMIVLEECQDEAWIEAERFYISYFRFLGCDLTNHDNGGRGMTRAPLAYRERVSERFKGRKLAPEHAAKIAAHNKTRVVSDETRRKMSESAKVKVFSVEQRRKMSERQQGRKRPKGSAEKSAQSRAKTYIVTSPSGEELVVPWLRVFCEERGLKRGSFNNVLRGKTPNYKGWKIRHFEPTT